MPPTPNARRIVMSRMKTALGLGLLSALCLCAFGASSASAVTLHECTKLFTGTEVKYSDAGCTTENVAGEYETAPISSVAYQDVKATHTSSFTLSATIAGVKFTITCSGLESVEGKAKNGAEGAEMYAVGEGKTKFTGCGVTAPVGKGCSVPSTIETVNLTSKTTATMGTKFTPKSGEAFVTIPVTKCTTEALNGNKIVKGTATSETKTQKTQTFTTTSGSSLTFGGQAATFTGDCHMTTTDGTPLALETP
jgi:hypothetical protein